MAGPFALIILTAAFGLVFALPVIIIPWLFAPRNPTPMKRATFEAGQVPSGDARVHLMMQYYAYLLIFVVFDVISMFLFAWATAFVAIPAALSIGVFLGVIFIPLGFAIYLAGKKEVW
ncbi:MAG TPA: NADH-quinone oxidoreductase subunit A [Nitrososphaerales archaeon]|nr:NADH-quinone oxidoreductase subunit A [Nitrososphaerales archaeon]